MQKHPSSFIDECDTVLIVEHAEFGERTAGIERYQTGSAVGSSDDQTVCVNIRNPIAGLVEFDDGPSCARVEDRSSAPLPNYDEARAVIREGRARQGAIRAERYQFGPIDARPRAQLRRRSSA